MSPAARDALGPLPVDADGPSPPDSLAEAGWLVDIAKGGSRAQRALEQLYHAYASRFRRYYLRRGFHPADADELCQDAFLKIVRSCVGRDIASPRAWLWTLARSVMLDHVKKARPELSGGHAAAEEAIDDPLADYGLRDCVQRQFTAFADSSPEGAQVVAWAVVDGFTAVEIAAMIDRSPGATREFLSQLRK